MERRDANTEAGRTAARGAVRAAGRWAAALTAAGLALTGCGAGQDAQTGDKVPAIDGINVNAGDLALRDLHVDFGGPGGYPEGGSAPLRVWIANEGGETVILEGVTSPDADAVTLVNPEGATGPTEIPPGGSSATPDGDPAEPTEEEPSPSEADGFETSDDASETPGADASETPSADASPTPGGDGESPTAAETATPGGDEGGDAPSGERDFTVEIAPGAHVRLEPEAGSYLMLEGLKEELTAASEVEVVFLFSNGEAVTVSLPMGEPAEAQTREYFEPSDDGH
ncbi:hypothetical protein LO763_04540 [Glycomyces sp. A-F 0318]|uniref:hypothetical protein n=1 Tax=Glycomyces amatae TaxID=2881355 RepID=UPI001E524785|nr:hypothetical protein [Glycomyces amatae]MCD0442892.1 hypothetical protein [Glycomyces amatae]